MHVLPGADGCGTSELRLFLFFLVESNRGSCVPDGSRELNYGTSAALPSPAALWHNARCIADSQEWGKTGALAFEHVYGRVVHWVCVWLQALCFRVAAALHNCGGVCLGHPCNDIAGFGFVYCSSFAHVTKRWAAPVHPRPGASGCRMAPCMVAASCERWQRSFCRMDVLCW